MRAWGWASGWFVTALLLLGVATPCWGQRELTEIPDPDPELERQSFVVADGFEVNLFVSDPAIAKPIQMNFDADGRLWIASSTIYPHIKPGQVADDKILIVEDQDRDGVADRSTVFADGLLIPTGVVPGDGGAYVANSTELVHLKDTDGDGKADSRRVVLSGFGTEDTHHLLHTLRWGPDGALYMNQSIYIHSHVETPHGVRRLNGGGIWRLRPDTLELEVLCRGFVNPWGHHFDRWGQSFATDGAYGEGINFVFPGSIFFSAPDAERILQGLNPGSPKHCGLEVLSGRHLPDDLQGDMITNDFRAHRVCRFSVTEDGSGYASHQETELIKTNHVAFRPIDVKMGPDGAIYVADWYNPIIQHGEVDFRDERRDQVHGRIWRITARGRPTLDPPSLSEASVKQLLDLLQMPEQWNRLHAKLILKQRGADKVVPELQAWVHTLDPQAADYHHHLLEALWLYQALDVVNEPVLRELLGCPDHRARAAAMRVLAHWHQRVPNAINLMRDGAEESHPRVRLEAVRALARLERAEAAQWAAKALDHPVDRFLDFAIWQTMRDLELYWLPKVVEGQMDFDGRIDHLTYALEATQSHDAVPVLLNLVRENNLPPDATDRVLGLLATLGGPQELGVVLDLVVDPQSDLTSDRRTNLLIGLVEASNNRNMRPAGDLKRIAPLVSADDPLLRAAGVRAAGVWSVHPLEQQLTDYVHSDEQPQDVRHAALQALGNLQSDSSIAALQQIASSSRRSLAERREAITALAQRRLDRACELAVAMLSEELSQEDLQQLISALLSRQEGAASLASAVRGKQLAADTAKRALRAVRSSANPSPELVQALQEAGRIDEQVWRMNPELTQRIIADVATADAARGETLYRRQELQCIKCHAIGGAGGLVGPDLVSIGASAPMDYLIESLLESNAKIKENYHSLVLLTTDGRLVTGIPVRQSEDELVLRDAEDKLVTLPVAAIDERQQGKSLMPDGLINSLTYDELVDLVAFLSQLGKVGEYSAPSPQVARRWQTLVWTREGHQRLNRTSFDTAASDDPALSWQMVTSRVSGDLPLDALAEFQPHQNNDPTTFLRCELDVKQVGSITLQFDSPKGLSLWIDGQPTPIHQSVTAQLDQGRHRITLAVNRVERSESLRLQVADDDQAVFVLQD